MTDLDLLHFEQLKSEIQQRYLESHTPSDENISNWKGIDIVYFQEDLRKIAKGNISEKSFYTYFKTSPVTKLPRIDILNLLSVYAGYVSWYDFKKHHLFANEILEEENEISEAIGNETNEEQQETKNESLNQKEEKKFNLQISNTENQENNKKSPFEEPLQTDISKSVQKRPEKNYIWIAATALLAVALGLLGFRDHLFDTTYTYCFTDADRNSPIQSTLEIKIIKENESPIFYRVAPGECFYYPTKDTVVSMQITSPFYEKLEISRHLKNAPKEETIQLKPDDYNMAVYYFSKKDISNDPDESLKQIREKRRELENRISDDAVIYQVFDNDIYGIETLDKQKYINLVTMPTTSLKNLSVIEMIREKGKIVSIKFKIKDSNEE